MSSYTSGGEGACFANSSSCDHSGHAGHGLTRIALLSREMHLIVLEPKVE